MESQSLSLLSGEREGGCANCLYMCNRAPAKGFNNIFQLHNFIWFWYQLSGIMKLWCANLIFQWFILSYLIIH